MARRRRATVVALLSVQVGEITANIADSGLSSLNEAELARIEITVAHTRFDSTTTQSDVQMAATRRQLTVYVLPNCANCEYAVGVAAAIRHDYPHVAVQVVDLANPPEPPPDSVFAAPTYLLDGRVWSLGNPSPEQIEAMFGDAFPDYGAMSRRRR